MFKALKRLFGSKQDRDVAIYQPVVEEINEIFAGLSSLSNDELRARTDTFRSRIAEYLSGIDEEIKKLRQEAEAEADFRQKDEIFKEVDRLEEQRNEELEVVLNEILPAAFATVKEAARRFTEGPLTMTATEADRELAAKRDYVTIDEDGRATYSNTWMAAGGEIEWQMIHYDVQLIGGQVLHDGKIAEMQTGEGKTLVATLPAYLNGLSGRGVHVVTVNNYLAQRMPSGSDR